MGLKGKQIQVDPRDVLEPCFRISLGAQSEKSDSSARKCVGKWTKLTRDFKALENSDKEAS